MPKFKSNTNTNTGNSNKIRITLTETRVIDIDDIYCGENDAGIEVRATGQWNSEDLAAAIEGAVANHRFDSIYDWLWETELVGGPDEWEVEIEDV